MSECWNWGGYFDRDGYGRLAQGLAHRIVYESERGPVPVGLQLDHLCRNRACVNPDHLEPVTAAVNSARAFYATKRECLNGHPYDEGNTYHRSNGSRACRACNREAVRRYHERKAV